MPSKDGFIGGMIVVLWVASIFLWFVHVWTCIREDSLGLLFIGATIIPIGIIHGLAILLGLT